MPTTSTHFSVLGMVVKVFGQSKMFSVLVKTSIFHVRIKKLKTAFRELWSLLYRNSHHIQTCTSLQQRQYQKSSCLMCICCAVCRTPL